MRYREIRPAPALRRWVHCYWQLQADRPDAGPREPIPPDGRAELIVNLADPFVARDGRGKATVQPRVMLVGQITGPLAVGPTGRVDIVGVRFEPWGAARLRRDQAELVNTWAGEGDLALEGPESIRDRLATAAGFEARVAILDDALGALARRGSEPDPRVEQAARAIIESHGTVSLGALAHRLGTTSRQLQRRFAMEVGVSPKFLARVSRFQRVLAAWRDRPGNWARVAAHCGYFDQSHLVRDFRGFTGTAPTALVASASEWARVFTALRAR